MISDMYTASDMIPCVAVNIQVANVQVIPNVIIPR